MLICFQFGENYLKQQFNGCEEKENQCHTCRLSWPFLVLSPCELSELCQSGCLHQPLDSLLFGGFNFFFQMHQSCPYFGGVNKFCLFYMLTWSARHTHIMTSCNLTFLWLSLPVFAFCVLFLVSLGVRLPYWAFIKKSKQQTSPLLK